MVFKYLNNLALEYLCSKFAYRNNITSYILRDSVNKLALPRTNYLKNTLHIVVRGFMEQLTCKYKIV